MLLQWHWFKNGIVMIQHFVSSENSDSAAKSMKLRKKRKVERKCQLFTWFFLAQMLPSLDIDFSQSEKEQSGDNSSDRRCLKLLLDVVITMSHLDFLFVHFDSHITCFTNFLLFFLSLWWNVVDTFIFFKFVRHFRFIKNVRSSDEQRKKCSI